MKLAIKGFIIGSIMVLPGMSAGTVLLIFGLYEKMINDLAKFNTKPYAPLVLGIVIGIFTAGFTVAILFENYRDATVALLLGCLLASIRTVLRNCPKNKNKRQGWVALTIGVVVGLIMVQEPLGLEVNIGQANSLILIVAGAISSAAMMIPGVPGSSVLIVFGVYDVILTSIAELDYINLLLFGLGSIIGITVLVNILSMVYEKYKGFASYFFVGLILGSARGVLPSTINPSIIVLFIIGFMLVWIWSGEGKKLEESDCHEKV